MLKVDAIKDALADEQYDQAVNGDKFFKLKGLVHIAGISVFELEEIGKRFQRHFRTNDLFRPH